VIARTSAFAFQADQLPRSRLLPDSLGIMLEIDRSRQSVGQCGKVGSSSGNFLFIKAPKFLPEREGVNRDFLLKQRKDRFENLDGLRCRSHQRPKLPMPRRSLCGPGESPRGLPAPNRWNFFSFYLGAGNTGQLPSYGGQFGTSASCSG
jgi:hypothetical protein